MKKILLLIMTVAMLAALSACGGTSSSNNDAKEPEPEPEYAVIGTESESAVQILLTNETGADIKSFVVRSDGSDDSKENLLAEGDVFAQGETRRFFYDVTASRTDAEDPEAKATPVEYRIVLRQNDGTKLVLHQFPMEDAKEATIKLEDKLGYIDYVSRTQEGTISTLDTEKAIKQAAIEKKKAKIRAAKKKAREKARAKKAAEAAAKAEAERQAAEAAAAAAAEQQAAQQAAAAAAAAQQQQSAGGGSDNGCLGGDALTY